MPGGQGSQVQRGPGRRGCGRSLGGPLGCQRGSPSTRVSPKAGPGVGGGGGSARRMVWSHLPSRVPSSPQVLLVRPDVTGILPRGLGTTRELGILAGPGEFGDQRLTATICLAPSSLQGAEPWAVLPKGGVTSPGSSTARAGPGPQHLSEGCRGPSGVFLVPAGRFRCCDKAGCRHLGL